MLTTEIPTTAETRRGTVVSIRGSVVDVAFADGLPTIYSLLHAGESGQIVIEVMSQLDAQRVRGIARDQRAAPS